MELAIRWDEEFLPEIKQSVNMIIGCLQNFVGSEHIEVQERVSVVFVSRPKYLATHVILQAANTLQLFTFIRADLAAFRPKPKPAPAPQDFGPGFSNGFADPPQQSVEPNFPKSLYLIRPLNIGYDLNPVAREAQASVPVPEGLDLDSWIITPPKEDLLEGRDATTNGMAKKKKSKGKERAGTSAGKVKSVRKKEKSVAEVNIQPEETPEEMAEQERVSLLY